MEDPLEALPEWLSKFLKAPNPVTSNFLSPNLVWKYYIIIFILTKLGICTCTLFHIKRTSQALLHKIKEVLRGRTSIVHRERGRAQNLCKCVYAVFMLFLCCFMLLYTVLGSFMLKFMLFYGEMYAHLCSKCLFKIKVHLWSKFMRIYEHEIPK